MVNGTCGTCEYWSCESAGQPKGSEIGLCTNPTVLAGRSCTKDMTCGGHKYKILTMNEKEDNQEQFPLMQDGKPVSEKKVTGLRMKQTTNETVFFPGDFVRLTLRDSYRIDSINKDNLWMSPLDSKGNAIGQSMLFAIGEHVLMRDFNLMEIASGERYGSGPRISA